MKRTTIFIGLFFLAVSVGLQGEAGAKQQWKFTNIQPAGQIYTEYFNKLAKDITEATNGEVEVTNYPAGELPYKGTDLLKVTTKGLVDMSEIVAGFVFGEAPLLALLDLPYVALNEKDRETFLDIAYPVIKEELRSRGVEPLGVVWYGPRQIVSRKPTKSLEDLKGQKVRTAGSLQDAYIKLWGAVPSFVVWAEVYPAAQRGIVDAIMTATLAIQQSKVYEVCPYFFKIEGPLMHQYICVNQKAWQSVSPENQKAIRQVVDKWTHFWIQKVGYELDDIALKEMLSKDQIKSVAELPMKDRLWTRKQLLPELKAYVDKHMQPKGPEVFAKVLKALNIE
jgi:TRAP-type C4-dicarboxylate transport system substrate-binding protein